jgi:phosphoribosylaminoimidazolecarboxamide formyltransferase/IMP cyclohydrolase
MRVLVSTSDKSGLIEFLKPLPDLKLVSTGGTFEYLKKNGFAVEEVSSVTGFPEVLDGRVKTLHPFIHMGLLADKSNPQHMAQLQQQRVAAFDMVVGNLYPFEQTALKAGVSFDDLIENIDIGGPSFLRAAAKNFNSVLVVASPQDYQWVQQKILTGNITSDDRKNLALKVFSLTSYYDALIVEKLCEDKSALEYLNIPMKKKSALRYGENGHQKAAWYANPLQTGGLSDVQIHQGKELSYNNILDLDAALNLACQLEQPGCVAVKHNNPCGAAVGEDVFSAAAKAIQSDPKSIFGGIVAINRPVDLKTSQLFKDIFLECVIAPAFTDESLAFFAAKKNLRVLSLPEPVFPASGFKSVAGGLLFQESDSFASSEWKFLGQTPGDDLLKTIHFGEKVAASLKSNAIAIVCGGQTVGLGMGQVNRVDAVKHAIERMTEYKQTNDFNLSEAVLVSDAFFPFSDSVNLIAKAGIKWIVQPGGSMQDQNVFEAARKNDINMVVTGRRHFKH